MMLSILLQTNQMELILYRRRVDSYLNNEEQKNYKKMIWEMMNQKYLDEQAAKKKMAGSNASKPKTKQRQKTAKDVKKDQSTTKPTPSKKRPSSRINHEALQNLFQEEPVPDRNTKRARTESETTRGLPNDLEHGEEDEADEEYGWEDNPRYPNYNDQDEDYYYDDDDDECF
ncbi:uncharacterized protein LOC141606443 isoform X2 [Silene latifolia]|uniref:uncharacterized protein LOC141606443 isoform X2 n=1 Tax=Silene latifolia TaxID=37657 RepID=UPI003D777D5E